MVITFGVSSSFRAVQERARQIDSRLHVADLEALEAAIQQSRDELAKQRAVVAEEVKKEVAALMDRHVQDTRAIEFDQPRWLAEAEEELRQAASQAAELRGRKAGLLMKIINFTRAFLRTRKGKRKVQQVHAETRIMKQSAVKHRDMALRLQADPFGEADRRLVHHADVIRKLEALQASPEARGSAGELAVAAELEGLSNDFCVCHDVRLRANTFVRFDGKPVQSAQVDHLVVGPTGIFLIETKSWSRKTASSGQFFDPFEQVGRAGLLCHCLLNDAGLPSRVRTVIASHQRIPDSRLRGYTERLAPDRLAGYLRTRQAALSASDVARVVAFVRNRIVAK